MANLSLYNVKGEEVGKIEIADSFLSEKINKQLLFDAVQSYLANQRSGTASTKTRAEVSGGGKKPWRQKGTGRARAGTIRSPLWKGGGIVFGPRPRDYSFYLGKKAKKKAIRGAILLKLREGKVKIVDSLPMNNPKTKEMVAYLKNIESGNTVLILTSDVDNYRNIYLSARNIPGVSAQRIDYVTVYELLKHKEIVMTKAAFERFKEVFGNEASE